MPGSRWVCVMSFMVVLPVYEYGLGCLQLLPLFRNQFSVAARAEFIGAVEIAMPRADRKRRGDGDVGDAETFECALLPSPQEFSKAYGLTPDRLALAKPDAIVMHPGPINRGVEIDSAVVDGPQSVILSQVTFGIAVRMAVMSIVAGNDA